VNAMTWNFSKYEVFWWTFLFSVKQNSCWRAQYYRLTKLPSPLGFLVYCQSLQVFTLKIYRCSCLIKVAHRDHVNNFLPTNQLLPFFVTNRNHFNDFWLMPYPSYVISPNPLREKKSNFTQGPMSSVGWLMFLQNCLNRGKIEKFVNNL
jgi:hypothetical protein